MNEKVSSILASKCIGSMMSGIILWCAPSHGKAGPFWFVFRSDISPHAARMEQSFSANGGKSWEVNWVCELSR